MMGGQPVRRFWIRNDGELVDENDTSIQPECGHNSYWITQYGNCMACRAETAERENADFKAKQYCGCNCHDLCKVPEANCVEHATHEECWKAVCKEYDENEKLYLQIADLKAEIERLKHGR